MLWRLYNSSRTTSAGTEIPRPRWEGFVRGPNNVRQILPIDDNKDPQQNSGEASGTQDGTSGNSSDERATRSLLTPEMRGGEGGRAALSSVEVLSYCELVVRWVSGILSKFHP